ncbi:MAG: folate-binding protein [Parvibaculum sp.]
MTGVAASMLGERGVLKVRGPEARSFLQNLITNNVDLVDGGRSVYAALLTPQGKFLFDFIVSADPADKTALLLDCDGARAEALAKRLEMYKLRAKVTIEDLSAEMTVLALWNEDGSALAEGPGLADPRLAALGRRAIVARDKAEAAIAAAKAQAADKDSYHRLRIGLGVGDAARDFEPDRTFPLEVNIAELNGIDFHKGCFIGQEVTSRTKRRGSVRKRLLPAHVEGDLPAHGTQVKGIAREVGIVLSGDAETSRVLALLRLDLIRSSVLEAGDAEIRPEVPSWLHIDLDGGEEEASAGDGD